MDCLGLKPVSFRLQGGFSSWSTFWFLKSMNRFTKSKEGRQSSEEVATDLAEQLSVEARGLMQCWWTAAVGSA